MKLILAPMEGLTDPPMRDVLTQIAPYDWCVTEFIRVTHTVLPRKTFYGTCPELHNGGRTASGTPVHVQLLGSDAEMLAVNAARAAELGAPAIDLNFGCPAKSVNRHCGGAILLEQPEQVYRIVSAVRASVPASIPVSAKMRLGYHDRSRMLDNAQAIASAGASWLTVHARTKAEGYRPPAHWQAIAQIRAAVALPVIANGEIWSPADAEQCRAQSGCEDLMLGRGAITHPDLALRLRDGSRPVMPWPELLQIQRAFIAQYAFSDIAAMARYKQWLGMLSLAHPEAAELFARVKKLRELEAIKACLSGG